MIDMAYMYIYSALQQVDLKRLGTIVLSHPFIN